MTKDLALLVGADQRWLSTTGFLDKVADNLTKAMELRRAMALSVFVTAGSNPDLIKLQMPGLFRRSLQ